MIFPRKSRMPPRVQKQLLEQFVIGTTARAAAKVVGVQERTAVVFFQRLRQLIASKQESFLLFGEVGADEHSGGDAHKEPREQGPAGQVPVFGLLMRGGKIYTAINPDAQAETLIPIIREHVTPDSIVYATRAQAYDVLNVSTFRHKCLKPGKTVLSRGGYHIDGIENFWNESRRYLRRFNGIPKTSFYWYLKDCEWRFNGSDSRALSKELHTWYRLGPRKQ